jgi:hypothetical protein
VEPLGPTAGVKAGELRLAFEVNVIAPAALTTAVLPGSMLEAGWGCQLARLARAVDPEAQRTLRPALHPGLNLVSHQATFARLTTAHLVARRAALQTGVMTGQGAGVTGEAAWPPPGMSFGEVPVLESRLAFVTGGRGDTVLFLHGNPTSSFLWRRVLPGLTGSARCVAVDLIGMGRSGKPDIGYGFAEHAAYLEAFADRLGLRDVTVVGHDWGAVLGLDLLRRRPDVVGRIAVCEGHLHRLAALRTWVPGERCSPSCALLASAGNWCCGRTFSLSRSCLVV